MADYPLVRETAELVRQVRGHLPELYTNLTDTPTHKNISNLLTAFADSLQSFQDIGPGDVFWVKAVPILELCRDLLKDAESRIAKPDTTSKKTQARKPVAESDLQADFQHLGRHYRDLKKYSLPALRQKKLQDISTYPVNMPRRRSHRYKIYSDHLTLFLQRISSKKLLTVTARQRLQNRQVETTITIATLINGDRMQ
jgi:hypothetical protein